MGNIVPDLIICFIIVGTVAIVHIISTAFRLNLGGEFSSQTLSQLVEQQSKEYSWILKLVLNCFGYSCIVVPGLLIYKYTKVTKYLERASDLSWISRAVRFCLVGADSERGTVEPLQTTKPTGQSNKTTFEEFYSIVFCFTGLMASYLTWGLLQEKIITKEYIDADGKRSSFKDSQFLVFANRLLAFVIACVYLGLKQHGRHRAPLYKYSFASFANIMSTWFQYEALKFVNFPTQVLAKSCKIIPVMIMGKIISRNKYEFYEYLTAGLISTGMIFFLTGSADESKASPTNTLTGVLLLIFYMIFDSFTSNWQGDLFKTYAMTSIQMMCGVNLFSTLFTAASLSIQGGFMASMEFAGAHPDFIVDCIVLSISSAIGQLFIFYTIAKFGPVVFTIIMTLRQAVAILLSCIVYNHHISTFGIFGVSIVFVAIFLRVYCNQRIKSLRKRNPLESAVKPRLSV